MIVRKPHKTASDKTQKGQGGRWKPGQSGNPKGCPKGSRHKATIAALALMEGDLGAITGKLIEKAKEGHQWAIKLVLDKLIPSARDLPVTFRAPALDTTGGLKAALANVLTMVANGKLTPSEAQSIALVMNSLGVMLAVESLEEDMDGIRGDRQ